MLSLPSSETPKPTEETLPADDWLDLEESPESLAYYTERQQAARRLRAALCSVPFYAKRAQAAKEQGDEMAYWLGLQSSEATLRRP